MLGTSMLDNLERDVYLASSSFENVLAGQVITWVTHASLVPEKRNVISVFSKFNHTYKVLAQRGKFALNLLAQDQTELASLFGLQSGNDTSKFTSDIQYELVDGLPILKGVAGSAILSILKEVDLGDRVAVIGRVEKEKYFKEVPALKLRYFLQNTSQEDRDKQITNYKKMVQRDAPLIKDKI